MKKLLLLVMAVAAIAVCSCQRERSIDPFQEDQDFVTTTTGGIIAGKYVVLLKGDVDEFKSAISSTEMRRESIINEADALLASVSLKSRTLENVYSTAVRGFSLSLDEAEAQALRLQPGVAGVWPDRMFILKKPGTDPVDPPTETLPYGISRVGYVTYTGSHVAWIIDTGIDLDHPDLNVDAARSTTFVSRTYTGEDDNGHGSHCAGIVAAIDNEIGVIGVASGATVVAVKVLDKRGSGAMSVIMAGVDYVAANASPGDAANMSLGGGVYEPLDIAVQNLGATGVYVALAAGNESDDANLHTPARANGPNLYTVSAMDVNDYWAYFSNFGNPPVDYCAPGVSILSTYKTGGYTSMSGTSMAAPHVCGLLLVTDGNIKTDGYVNGDPDGNPDPIAHK